MADGLLTVDGVTRCWWAGDDPLYLDYHDTEWGRPATSNRQVFEKLCLEAFQSGLSWITILRKRENCRMAFAGFDPTAVAQFDQSDVERLMGDAGIVRNRAKIEASIANATVFLDLVDEVGSVYDWFASFGPDGHQRPTCRDDVPAVTPESTALAKELRRRGFRWLGPTTVYAHMQADGIVNDHLIGCQRAD